MALSPEPSLTARVPERPQAAREEPLDGDAGSDEHGDGEEEPEVEAEDSHSRGSQGRRAEASWTKSSAVAAVPPALLHSVADQEAGTCMGARRVAMARIACLREA